ncbi:MAG: HEPN domain-containing protein [Nanoarchaeota archaeon]
MECIKVFNWEKWLEDKEECEDSFKRYLEKGMIKTEEEKTNLSKSHMKKSDGNIGFANYLLEEKKFYDWVIVGCYYAAYHASLALLAIKGYSSKNHYATLCGLIKLYYDKDLDKEDIELVAKASIEKEEISYFAEAKEKRETASYGVSEEFNKNEAISLKEKTINFVNKARRIWMRVKSFLWDVNKIFMIFGHKEMREKKK